MKLLNHKTIRIFVAAFLSTLSLTAGQIVYDNTNSAGAGLAYGLDSVFASFTSLSGDRQLTGLE